MSKIKIVSNPYKNTISFFKLREDEWEEITYKSKDEQDNELLKEKYRKGFFPFVAKDIVQIIVEQYGDETEIEFQGTKEAFIDLKEICKNNKNIKLYQSEQFLNNANEVLNDIVNIYEKARNVIKKSVKDEADNEEAKFIEASNDVIPLCIIGNYSSGKSTFINALIGNDILPSGDDPVTANVYKIKKSIYNSIANIKFKIENEPIEIIFDGENHLIKKSNCDNSVLYQVDSTLKEIQNKPLNEKVYRTIEILNSNSKDIVNFEIEVPFVNSILGESGKEFVIFDTPGSDSSTYEIHLKVLKKQLENLSNGLIIFIVDRLDSEGNEKLYKMLKEIKELDSRFTMIVVNKADDANLPDGRDFTEEEANKKLSLTIPRNLYSNGIYYVSSILGLGAKNGGNFINSHNAEVFDMKKDKYGDPNNKYYKQLYRYDIMPEQLKERMISDAEKCDNRVLANSGLYAVEHEVLTFANLYSAYNKCQQSQLYLEKVIKITDDMIDEHKVKVKKYRQALVNEMEREKQELCNSLEKKKDEYNDDFDKENRANLNELLQVIKNESEYDIKKMQILENDLRKEFENKHGFEEMREKNKENKSEQSEKLKESFDSLMKNKDVKSAINLFGKAIDVAQTGVNSMLSENVTKKEINKDTSNKLYNTIKAEFDEKAKNNKDLIYNKSKEFYDKKLELIKKELLELINVTDVLTDEQKTILKNIILDYEDIKFGKKASDIFVEQELKIKILGFIQINKYDSKKLTKLYNDNMNVGLTEVFNEIIKSHKNGFNKWLYFLVESLENNIAKFNPELLSKAEEIESEDREIERLENDQEELLSYSQQLNNLIDWKFK